MYSIKAQKSLVLPLIFILIISSLLISFPIQAEGTSEIVSEQSLENNTTQLFSSFSEIHSSVDLERSANTSSIPHLAEGAKRVAEVEFKGSLYNNISKGMVIELNIFDNYEIIVEDMSNSLDLKSGRGRVRGSEFGFFIFSMDSDVWSFTLELPEEQVQYAVRYVENSDTHLLYENSLRDIQEKRSESLDVYDQYSYLDSSYSQSTSDSGHLYDEQRYETTPQSSNKTDIDVMIVYTPNARDWASENGGGIHNVINSAQQRANMVMDNSEVEINLNTVHAGEVDYTESGDSAQDLMRLTNTSDGYMEEVHEWRDYYGADLVSLFAEVYDVGGIAWQLDDPDGWPGLGFSLTNVQQASITYTHVHEMGHNMGAHHHKEQDVQPGPGLFSYSAGWRWSGGRSSGDYVSVMTYRDPLDETYPIFSNPDVEHMGDPTGCPIDGDNARTLRETKEVIANYRESTSVPYFKIRSIDVEDTVEGETLEVTTTIENTGDISGTQDVKMNSDIGDDSESVYLDPGDRKTITLSNETSIGDVGEYSVEVITDDFSKSDTFKVLEPIFFEVSISEITGPIIEGEHLELDIDVHNTEYGSGEQTIYMYSDVGSDSESVYLESDEIKTITLSTETSSGDAGEHEVTVNSEDDSVTENFRVLEPAFFDVSILEINGPVIEGESLEVEVQIENTGEVSDEQIVEMSSEVGDYNESVYLESDEIKTITLSTETSSGDAGEHEVTVNSEDVSITENFTVLEPAFFDVFILETTGPVIEGESLEIEVQIENTGDVSDEQTLEMSSEIGDDSESVYLESDEIKTITLSTDTSSGDAGEYEVIVYSEDVSTTENFTVLEPAFFDISIQKTDGPVIKGESMQVYVDIINSGDVENTQHIELFYDSDRDGNADNLADSKDVRIEGGSSVENIVLELQTEVDDSGEFIINVTSGDDHETHYINVLEPAYYELEFDFDEEIIEGDKVVIEYKVTNLGDVQGEQDLEFYVDGELIEKERDLMIQSDEAYKGEFTWTAEEEGEFGLEIKSEDDTETVDIFVQKGFLASYWWALALISLVMITIIVVWKKT